LVERSEKKEKKSFFVSTLNISDDDEMETLEFFTFLLWLQLRVFLCGLEERKNAPVMSKASEN
jgi:hypothetical protein